MARALLVLLLAVAASQAGHVRLPFQNPAGVTYINHDAGFAAAPVQYAAHAPVAHAQYAHAPVAHYAAPAPVAHYAAPAPVAHAHYAAAPVAQYAAHAQYAAAPVAHAHYAAAPVAHAHYAHAPVAHAHYATPLVGKVPAVAHVPAIAKVHGVADVPVTKIHHTPGVINKEVDFAQPALNKRLFQVRRPAVRKEFYDVETRVIVRPSGSALFELDQPISKTQIGSDAIVPTHGHVGPFVKAQTSRKIIEGPAGQYAASPLSALGPQPSAPQRPPQPFPAGPAGPEGDDAVVIPSARSAQPPPPPPPQGPSPFQPQEGPSPFQPQGPPQRSAAPRDLPAGPPQRGPAPPQGAAPRAFPPPPPQQHQHQQQEQHQHQQQQQDQHQHQQQQQHQPQLRSGPGGPISEARLRTVLADMPLEVQNRLVHLLGARGAVHVVDGRDGPASVRVLEAAEESANLPPPGEERITTRRIALLRPVETIQDVEIAEPITKLHRYNVQQPALFKTATTGIARVPTSIPVQTTVPVAAKVPAVVGHAYTPAFQGYAAGPAGYYQG